jgi:hypothetical protein
MLTPPSNPDDLLRDIRGERLSTSTPQALTGTNTDPDLADIMSHVDPHSRGIFITYQPGVANRGVLRYLVLNADVTWANRVLIDVLHRLSNGTHLE